MEWSADPVRPPPLEARQLHVWRLHLVPAEQAMAELTGMLSAEEREKAARFRFDRDRVRYVAAHAGLRCVLAGYLGCTPAGVEMGPGALGKPLLAGTGRAKGLSFNLSHSGDWGLVAIGQKQHIGVDIEQHRDLPDLAEVAQSVLSPAEMAVLQAREAENRTDCFFKMWTRKEAVVKATGAGIGAAFSEIEIEPADPFLSDEFTVCAGLTDTPSLFGNSFVPVPGCSAAVVCEDSRVRVVYSEWPQTRNPRSRVGL